MKFYVDDVRKAPAGFIKVFSVDEMKLYCMRALTKDNVLNIELIDLDHDAGDYADMGGDYIEILKWLEEMQYTKNWKIPTAFRIHSGNNVGIKNMTAIINHCGWRLV